MLQDASRFFRPVTNQSIIHQIESFDLLLEGERDALRFSFKIRAHLHIDGDVALRKWSQFGNNASASRTFLRIRQNQNCSEIPLEFVGNCLKVALISHWNLPNRNGPETALKFHWNSPGIALKLLRASNRIRQDLL